MQELDINAKDGWVFDLDGVIYNGSEEIAGASDLIHFLEANGKKCMYLTNNSTKSRKSYVRKLATFGIDAPVDAIYTSAVITAEWLQEHCNGAKKSIFVIGESGLKEELTLAGFSVVDEGHFDGDDLDSFKCIDFVVVGLDTNLTYRKLFIALNCIKQGAKFIATNDDNTLPLEGGLIGPGTGSIIQALVNCSKKQPELGSPFGKPNPIALEGILQTLDMEKSRIIVVGDRPETDILVANNAGIDTILVLSGITKDASMVPEDCKPTVILGSVKEILKLVQN